MALSGNNVYVTWTESYPYYSGSTIVCCMASIFLKASLDNGSSWNNRLTLSDSARDAIHQKIAASENNVYVVWRNMMPTGSPGIVFRASNDNGASFSDIINLHPDNNGADYPEIAASGNNVYVVWQTLGTAGDIFFARSTNGGASFETPIQMGDIWGEATYAKVIVEGSNVYVAWSERTTQENLDVYFRASNDYGATFGSVINLSNNPAHAYDVEIAASGNDVYAIWRDFTPGNPDIFFKASNDNGTTFGSTINLSNTAGWSANSRIVASEDNVYVVWDDPVRRTIDDVTIETSDIFFSVSNNNGATFTPTNLSDNLSTSQLPEISVSGENVYVIWRDGYRNTPEDVPIGTGLLLRASDNAGVTFDPALQIGGNASLSWPELATSGAYIHVVRFVEIEVVEDGRTKIKEYVVYLRSPPGYADNSPIPPDPVPPFANPPPPSNSPSTALEVTVDVKPYSSLNTVNCNTLKGGVPVGILSEDGFDAQDIDVSTLELEGISAQKYALKDLDGDGDLDGVARFKKADLCESSEILSSGLSIRMTLTGLTDDDKQFEGGDIIRFRR